MLRSLSIFFIVVFLCGCCSCVFKGMANKETYKSTNEKNEMTTDEVSEYMSYQSAMVGGDIATAETIIKSLIENKPAFIEFYIDLINIYVYKKDMDKALDTVDNALKIDAGNPDLLLAQANILVLKGNLRQAVMILEKIIDVFKDKENVVLMLANLYYQEKEYKKAISVLERYLKGHPDNFLANFYIAKVFETINKEKDAAIFYERAFQEREEDEILINLDRIYDKLGDRRKSIDVLEKFITKNPDYSKIRERLALLYISENEYEKAVAHFEALTKQFPENIELKFKAAYAAIEGNIFETAQTIIAEILNKEPTNQKALYFAGLLYKELREWKKAATFFEKIRDEDYLKISQLYLAVCYEKSGQKEKAFKILRTIWERDKDGDVAYFLAIYYKNNKDYDKAIGILSEIIGNNLKSDKHLYLLAEIYIKKGEFNKGISVVERMLTENPDNAEALNFIGYSYLEKGMHMDKAETMIKRALDLKPGDPYITDSLAWFYYVNKNYTAALELQKKAVEKQGNDPTILEHMGDILNMLGKRSEAKKYFLEALRNDPENIEILNKKIEELKNH